MQTIRIGIVGCGEVTQIMHLPSLFMLGEQFQVTALCDVSQQLLDAVGGLWGVANRLMDYHDLVTRDDVDAVLIANPNGLHAAVTLAALAAGKHVLVEKPMCMTLEENDAIVAAAASAGRVVQVGTMRRYAPAFIQACELVRALPGIKLARVHDVIGHNHLIIGQTSRVVRPTDVPQSVKDELTALERSKIDEAIGDAPPALQRAYALLLGLSSHDTSAMRELLGMPKRVLYAAQRQNGLYLTAAFDYGDFVCQFETGVDQVARFDAHLEIYGDDRVIRVDYETPYVRNLPITLTVLKAGAAAGESITEVTRPWGDAFVQEWRAFYENVTAGKMPKTSAQDFREDLVLYRDMIALMRG